MKDFVYNKKGVIYVNVIFISLIIFVLSTSLLNILLNNNIIINSNNDNYRAGYIVESILELKLEEIIELCDKATDNYLTDLQAYNMEYTEADHLQAYDMGDTEITGNSILYNPPGFSSYIANLASGIEDLSEWENNPFAEYGDRHYYKIDIKCDLSKNCINITSRGEYRQARKFINVELELPKIINDGDNKFSLSGVVISPAKVTRYYQTVGL